jgi:hypothetical protein
LFINVCALLSVNTLRVLFKKINADCQENSVKILRMLLALLLMQAVFISSSSAGDFDWMDNLNVMAESDSSGFRIRLATRFHIGDAEVSTVFSNTKSPADAYMIFRLGELSHRPISDVVDVYRTQRKKGWGVMAKHLGIKPGSREFHALKRGHDLHGGHNDNGRFSSGHKNKNKGKGMGNGMGKGKH